jgi:uncharacterized membrane-anchored protein
MKDAVLVWLKGLYKPFADSIKGKISWKEVVSAALVVVLYFLLGGDISALLSGVVAADPHTIQEVVSGIFVLVVTLFHKKWQGEDKKEDK